MMETPGGQFKSHERTCSRSPELAVGLRHGVERGRGCSATTAPCRSKPSRHTSNSRRSTVVLVLERQPGRTENARPTGWFGEGDFACRRVEHQIIRRIFVAPISCTMTFCSRLSSSGSKAGLDRMSDSSIERQRHIGLQHAAQNRPWPRTLVAALMIAADLLRSSSEICRAERRFGALEGHMFKQMGNAMLVRPLIAAARADPHAKRGASRRCGIASVTTERPEEDG